MIYPRMSRQHPTISRGLPKISNNRGSGVTAEDVFAMNLPSEIKTCRLFKVALEI